MDFHGLARRELQALCKLNKIPANMTNVAMADALTSLDFVDGIEDFFKPPESSSVTAESSIESPERNVATSPKVPRTTRRKPVREESEGMQTVARSTRRTTRKAAPPEITEASKTPAVRSSRKKVPEASVIRMEEIHFKESEVIETEEKKGVPETPALVPYSRRKGAAVSTRLTNLKEEKEEAGATVQRVYSTRRSTRLSEKKPVESILMVEKTTEPIKIDLVSSEISDLSGVSEYISVSGNESLTVLEEESIDKSESVASQIVRETKNDDNQEGQGDGSNVVIGENDGYVLFDLCKDIKGKLAFSSPEEGVEEHHHLESLSFHESYVVASESARDTKDDDVLKGTGIFNLEKKIDEATDGLDSTEILIEETLKEEALDMQNEVLQNKDMEASTAEIIVDSEEETRTDMKTEAMEALSAGNVVDSAEKTPTDLKPEVQVFSLEPENQHEHMKLVMEEEYNNINNEESDGSTTMESSSDDHAEAKKVYSETFNNYTPKVDADQTEVNCIANENDPICEQNSAIDSVSVSSLANDPPTNQFPSGGVGFLEPGHIASICEQKATSPPVLDTDNVFASNLADDPLTHQFPSSVVELSEPLHIASPIQLTLMNKSSAKTPKIMLTHVSDDKENINETEKKNKSEITLNDKHKSSSLHDKSLRELTKMLKEKLQISANQVLEVEKESKGVKVTRPALQMLSDNILVPLSNLENN